MLPANPASPLFKPSDRMFSCNHSERMKPVKRFLCAAMLLPFSASQAFAFNWGFVRAPDWMDAYLLVLAIISAVFFLALSIVKPSGVPVNRLYYVRLSPGVRMIHIGTVCFFGLFMILLFVGMGLQRYAET